MSYFTERNNMRRPIEHTETISVEMYGLLFDCCEKFMENIAYVCPEQCPDGRGICGVDYKKLRNKLKFEIPTIFTDGNGWISSPELYDEYDQFALLDYIEFIAQSCKDIVTRDYHSFFGHYELRFNKDSDICFKAFQSEINCIFGKTGLLYLLTDQKIIERIVEHGVLTNEVIQVIRSVPEEGIKELLDEALNYFRQPNPTGRKIAVEKIWDALERLKTYYSPSIDKKASVTKIVSDMASDDVNFSAIFDTEFKSLTSIGNDFRIRHHETTKIDITDIKHYDYFFNRCLSLIALAIQYLK